MKTLLVLSTLVVSAACLASGAKKIACAVMPGNKVDIAAATAHHRYADYKGNRYFFCCGDCPKMFAKNPAKYVHGAHIKTPKVTHAKKVKGK